MLVIFMGPPGAGKGTQAKRLISHLGAQHLSTGDILRAAIEADDALGQKARSYMDQGHLVPCEIMIDLIRNRLKNAPSGQNFLVDGFPRTLHQAEELDRLLAEMRRSIRVVMVLKTDRDELRRRLVERAREEGRTDDNPETIAHRLAVYDEQTAPLIEYYRKKALLREIDGMGTPAEVFQRIQSAVDST